MRFGNILALGLATVLLLPGAGALAVGIGADANGIGMVDAAGGHATYGQIWAGTWLKSSGWAGWDAQVAGIRDAGATPIILWYYWGDRISTSCVASGCSGMSVSDWDAMTKTMATHAKSVMGDASFLVVLEPEFNKGGIAGDRFDSLLAQQSATIKSIAPNAKTIVGFGSWGGYQNFPKAVAAADMTGFQFMRASTRDAAASAEGVVDGALATTQQLRALYPDKPVVLFDLAIGSYGGWEGVQQGALQSLASRHGELEAAGLAAVVYRYARDNDYSSGYFGPAESSWGLQHADGTAKPAWSAFVQLAQTGDAGVAAPTFTNVRGNDWWEEADVAGAPLAVSASVDGAPAAPMTPTAWGSWAAGLNAPAGSIVTFVASYADGSTRTLAQPWG